MKAVLKNYHQSPRKVRLIADLIRGKSVPSARAALAFMPQKSSPAISKLLDSAVANARSSGVSVESLFVKTIAVNKGGVMRRSRPFARGRSGSIRKTMSIVTLELGANAPAKKARAKKVAKVETK
jgi:large subunit ribosomal protein L22